MAKQTVTRKPRPTHATPEAEDKADTELNKESNDDESESDSQSGSIRCQSGCRLAFIFMYAAEEGTTTRRMGAYAGPHQHLPVLREQHRTVLEVSEANRSVSSIAKKTQTWDKMNIKRSKATRSENSWVRELQGESPFAASRQGPQWKGRCTRR